MAWNDDSWKDSYDDWKLRSPDEEYGYDEEPCDHDDYAADGVLVWMVVSQEIHHG